MSTGSRHPEEKVRRFEAGTSIQKIIEALDAQGIKCRYAGGPNKKPFETRKHGSRGRPTFMTWKEASKLADKWRMKQGLEPLLK